jgi:hypothetical protein
MTVKGARAECPAQTFDQVPEALSPKAVTHPKPVMAALRRAVFTFECRTAVFRRPRVGCAR